MPVTSDHEMVCPGCGNEACCTCGVCHTCDIPIGLGQGRQIGLGANLTKGEVNQRLKRALKERAKEAIESAGRVERDLVSKAESAAVRQHGADTERTCSAPDGTPRVQRIGDLEQVIWAPRGMTDRRSWSLARTAGVEIETQTQVHNRTDWMASLGNTLDEWTARPVTDGSIDGLEICTAPAGGDFLVKQISEICRGLHDLGIQAWSRKCGMHTHIYVGDFDWPSIRRLIWLGCVIEEGLFSLCKSFRRGTSYARMSARYLLPIVAETNPGNVFETKEAFVKRIYSERSGMLQVGLRPGETEEKRAVRYNIMRGRTSRQCLDRYLAFNLASYVYRGTVEFRHFHGCTDFREMMGWIKTVSAAVQWAYQASEAEARSLYEAYEGEEGSVTGNVEAYNETSFNLLKKVVSTKGILRTHESRDLLRWMDKQRNKMME